MQPSIGGIASWCMLYLFLIILIPDCHAELFLNLKHEDSARELILRSHTEDCKCVRLLHTLHQMTSWCCVGTKKQIYHIFTTSSIAHK